VNEDWEEKVENNIKKLASKVGCVSITILVIILTVGLITTTKKNNKTSSAPTIKTQGESMVSLGPENVRWVSLSWLSPDASLEELVYAAEQNPVWIKLPEDMTIQMSFLEPEADDFCWVLYPNGEFVLDRPGQNFAHQTPSKHQKKMVRPRGMNYVKILGGKGTYSIKAIPPSR
jgi:hypothetical protein